DEPPPPPPAAVEPEPVPAPEPVSEPLAVIAPPEPEPVAAQATPDLSATLVAWPSNQSVPTPGNGSSPGGGATFEEATSVIPVWQQTDPNASSKETVSLQAMPPEEVAAGSSYAALLTFESGPFAGRIVALPV